MPSEISPNELPCPEGRGINIGAIFFASANAEETPQAAGNMALRDSNPTRQAHFPPKVPVPSRTGTAFTSLLSSVVLSQLRTKHSQPNSFTRRICPTHSVFSMGRDMYVLPYP